MTPTTNSSHKLDALYIKSKCPLVNGSKEPAYNAFLPIEERRRMIEEETKGMKNVKIVSFSGLLADYVNVNGFDIVVRGLRATMDFEYEIQMAQMNARLYNKNVETIFLMTNPHFSFISSSMIKEVFSLNGDVSGLVPENILQNMKNRK